MVVTPARPGGSGRAAGGTGRPGGGGRRPGPGRKPRPFPWQRLYRVSYSIAAIGLMALVVIFIVGLLLYSGPAQQAVRDLQNPAAAAARTPRPLGTPTPDRSRVAAKAYDAEDVARLLASGEAYVIDVRPTGEWLQSRIPGVASMPHYHLQGQAPTLPKDRPIITICNLQLCPQGPEAARLVINAGVDNVGYLNGGFEAWAARGLPVEGG